MRSLHCWPLKTDIKHDWSTSIPSDHSLHLILTFAPHMMSLLHLLQHDIDQYKTSQHYLQHQARSIQLIEQYQHTRSIRISQTTITDTLQLNALTHSDHVHEVDDIHALTASKCITQLDLSYRSPFPAIQRVLAADNWPCLFTACFGYLDCSFTFHIRKTAIPFFSLFSPFPILMMKIRQKKGTGTLSFSAFEKGIKVSFFQTYFTIF